MPVELRKVTQLAWRRMLITEEGKEALLWLREHTPRISKGSSDEVIFQAGVNQGYTQAIEQLCEFIAQEPKRDINPENP